MIESIEQIRQEALSCTKCPELVAYRKQVVFSYGSGNNGIMFIGIAPSYIGGNITGRPMSDGKSKTGFLVQKILDFNKLVSEECYNTNILFCSTPYNREPTPSEIHNCLPYTKREIAIIQPKLVILLGRIPALCFLGTTYIKGSIYRKNSTCFFPTFHPSYILKQENRNLEAQYIDSISGAIHATITI